MKKLGCLVLCLSLLTACAPKPQTETIFAMDTVMELTAYGPDAQQALTAAEQEVNRLEGMLSAHREGSAIWEINAGGGESVAVTPEVGELLRRAMWLHDDTQGALDITIYPAMEAWGFTTGEYRVPGEEELAAVRKLVCNERLAVEPWRGDPYMVTLSQGMKLDLGAVGKGYAADQIIAIWKDIGLTSGLLNLGGNVQCLGARPDGKDWTVAIRDPDNENELLATVSGQDMAVVTSGSYQRYFEEDGQTYHHILDPMTCAPARSGAKSVTIIGQSGFVCDALSTALFVMGPEKAAEYWQERHDFDFIYYTEGGTLWYTSGLVGRVTLREGLEGQLLT